DESLHHVLLYVRMRIDFATIGSPGPDDDCPRNCLTLVWTTSVHRLRTTASWSKRHLARMTSSLDRRHSMGRHSRSRKKQKQKKTQRSARRAHQYRVLVQQNDAINAITRLAEWDALREQLQPEMKTVASAEHL